MNPVPASSAPPTTRATPSPLAPHPSGHDTVVVIDYGSQTSQLIVRRVREAGVYCEMLPWDAPATQVAALAPKAYILSGGPASVYEPNAPTLPGYVLAGDVPVLAICYGMQLLAHELGGAVVAAERREYGPAEVSKTTAGTASPLLGGLPNTFPVWMSHGDHMDTPPTGFQVLAASGNAPLAAISRVEDGTAPIYGIQFHPEVAHTPQGARLIANFLFGVAGLHADWSPAAFIEEAVASIRRTVGDARVLCGLSGGVDSAVVAALLHRAIGEQLICVFVDTGLLREGEAASVQETFGRHLQIDLRVIQAADRFLARLEGVSDPEEKRRRIGTEFVRVFEEATQTLGTVPFLAQGTLYPDIIESATPERKATRIKTHHNVGGLPADMQFRLIEPLRYLFKDEARAVGAELGLPDEIVWRQPFPGPGLAVRILGPVTAERVATLQQADAIMRAELRAAGLERTIWQSFAVLTNVQSVGVMGDFRTYADAVAIRAVTSVDGMTADWARIPYDVLGRISNRIVNEVPNVNRVVYDITSKPPATIEWE